MLSGSKKVAGKKPKLEGGKTAVGNNKLRKRDGAKIPEDRIRNNR